MADKDFKVKNGIDVAGNANIGGTVNAATLQQGGIQAVTTTGSQTLTNKTLTTPKINEDVTLTATSTELNVLDGITASTVELNIMDGVTTSTTELNYVDGVTSSIQTQLNSKAASDSVVSSFNGVTGAITGVNSVNGSTGTVTGLATTAGKLSQFASTTSAELASVISNQTGSGSLVFSAAPTLTGNTKFTPANVGLVEITTPSGNGAYFQVSDTNSNVFLITPMEGGVGQTGNQLYFDGNTTAPGGWKCEGDFNGANSTEMSYLAGVTSAIQTQLNGKQATITGGATTIASSNLTASRALVSDASGKVVVSSVLATELARLDGLTATASELNRLDGLTSATGNSTLVLRTSGGDINANAANFVRGGSVTITPVANTMTSGNVSWGVTMPATPFVAVSGASSSVSLENVSFSDNSTTGCTVWIRRTNTTATTCYAVAVSI